MTTTINTTFAMYDKAMTIITDILGEDIDEVFRISVIGNVCKIIIPLHVSLSMLCDRDDVMINFINNTSEILVF